MRVPFEQMKKEIKRALMNANLTEEQADICAHIHAETSLDGVYSHGLNRVPRFIEYIKKGWVNPEGKPELIKKDGCAENYDGNMGIGVINALFCADRAVQLAKENSIGLVSLRNTTHWMRAGSYAWRMADQGFLSICWTNTESCIPAWGAKNLLIGNNPFCMGIPSEDGNVILDMSMSQFSYGKMEVTALKGEQLPMAGGYDADGNLSTDPNAILATRRLLPTGYWKGSAMAITLDLLAAILANGLSTGEVDIVNKGACGSCCQIFLAINPRLFCSEERLKHIVKSVKEHLAKGIPVSDSDRICYPGQRTLETRLENKLKGIPVDETVWQMVCSL